MREKCVPVHWPPSTKDSIELGGEDPRGRVLDQLSREVVSTSSHLFLHFSNLFMPFFTHCQVLSLTFSDFPEPSLSKCLSNFHPAFALTPWGPARCRWNESTVPGNFLELSRTVSIFLELSQLPRTSSGLFSRAELWRFKVSSKGYPLKVVSKVRGSTQKTCQTTSQRTISNNAFREQPRNYSCECSGV